jgi:hypothetical protein
MKYIDELKPGDLFLVNNERFILTSDFRLSKEDKYKRLSVNISNGFLQWVEDDKIVESLDLYFRDKEGNIIALKEIKNEYSEKTTDLF